MSVDARLEGCLRRSQRLGFLGKGSVDRHLAHGEAMIAAVASLGLDVGSLVDLGSGGGVPGLSLVAAGSAERVVLSERRGRRADLLELSIAELGCAHRAEVDRRDAFDLARSSEREGFDVVVARSFGPPSVVVEYGLPLLREAGVLLVSDVEGGETRWPPQALAAVGGVLGPRLSGEWLIQVVRKAEPTTDALPRRGATPRRRFLEGFT